MVRAATHHSVLAMRISLCLICRDELANLERCLASARGVADEVCVLDTGSTDGTPELARRLGARVVEREWTDDFSAARNACLELARGDRVLVLDADEELVGEGAREALERFAAHHPEAVGRLRLTNVGAAGTGPEGSDVDLSRFLPRLPGFCFRGRVHEQIVREGAPAEREDTGARILHRGYQAHALEGREKLRRNRRLVTAAIEDDPGDPYLWFHLGRTEFVAGEHRRAWEASERAIELLAGGTEPYLGTLYETAGYALRELGRSAEALRLLRTVEARFQRRADTRFLLALLSMDTGLLREAEAGFRACLELEGTTPEGGETCLSASTWAPAFNLGVMNEVLTHPVEARGWYRRALSYHPDHQPSRDGLARLAAAG